MRKHNFFLYTTVILALVVACLLICNSGSVVYVDRIKKKILPVYVPELDTVIEKDTTKIVDVVKVHIHDTVPKYDTIYLRDTIFVYNDYSQTRVYKDTIRASKSLDVAIIDTVRYNRIISRQSVVISQISPLKTHFSILGGVTSEKSFIFGLQFNRNRFGYFSLYDTRKVFSLGVTYKIR